MNNALWVVLMAANAANSAASSSCSNASDTSVVTGLIIITVFVLGGLLLWILVEVISNWLC